ncbi:MAG: glycosyltransferase family 10 [Gammaproteobacteria bacterium]|nr:glycosyltransferase family 10 [Gammaproteobacteria bacterium]
MNDISREPVTSRAIRVKFLSKTGERIWRRQLPGHGALWGNCEFIFDKDERDYDWLVVYDDLPSTKGERFSVRVEPLSCARENTLLVTTEPSSIKSYGSAYTAQFGHVLTSQEPWALPHPNRIYSQPALRWFYGVGRGHEISYDHLASAQPPSKSKTLSTVCSSKRQKHTLHNRRYEFTLALKALLPELDIYGHGVRDMDDKAEALDDYRYHIAIENYVGAHHCTEKLSDAFLGFTLPFYYGCPNAEQYFPPRSFIRIDIGDIEKTRNIIARAIADNEYQKRLPDIVEARRRVLEDYNIFSVLANVVGAHHAAAGARKEPFILMSRRALITRHPLAGLRHLFEKARVRLLHSAGRGQ